MQSMPFKSILLLGFYHPRYINALLENGKVLEDQGFAVTYLMADKHYKEEVLDHLLRPYDLVIYFGHGEPGAIGGYRSICQDELPNSNQRQQRTVALLCCSSLEIAEQMSLGEQFLSNGLATKVVGYRGKISFEKNKKMLLNYCSSLSIEKTIRPPEIESLAKKCTIENLGILIHEKKREH